MALINFSNLIFDTWSGTPSVSPVKSTQEIMLEHIQGLLDSEKERKKREFNLTEQPMIKDIMVAFQKVEGKDIENRISKFL